MANMITFSGDSNRGTQMGINSGHISSINHYYSQPAEGSPIKPEPSSTVPFRRDTDFVDRGILAEVDKLCSKPAARAALVGLGGVGKSQLAIEYSYRVRERFPRTWIFWVHASNAARFEEGYRTIADRIKLPGRGESTANILQLVSNWLSDEANGRWIMILDNADDSAVFSDPRKGVERADGGAALSLSHFLPQTPNGSILVTSRSGETALRLTGRHRDIIKVEPMDEDGALLLFEKKLPIGFDNDNAKELLRVLDYMPLAISQAAAYISQRTPRTTVARYLDTFHKSDENQKILLDSDTGDLRRDSSALNSIITTWQISYEYIRDKRPSAARLLALMSFFDRQGIPEFLLHHYDDRETDSDVDLGNNPKRKFKDDSNPAFENDIFTLTSYSLIRANDRNNHFEMHRLVQFSTRKWLELNYELEKWQKTYIVILWNALPTGEFKTWKTCRVLFPHAEALLAFRPMEKRHLLIWCEILSKAGSFANLQGNFSTAEKLIRRALEEMIKTLGDKHFNTLKSMNDLALVLGNQGKYKAAEKMHRRVLDGSEKALGPEHSNTLASTNNLALVLEGQGKYKEAEKMSRRALDGREKALGKVHPDTLTSVNNLALVLQSQGKYKEAEKMSRRALDRREKALGKEHPDTLASIHNLALVLESRGKYEMAEEMSRRAVDGRVRALGKDHPDMLASINNLALVLRSQEKYKEAEEVGRQALDGYERVLGKKHPDTLTSIHNLASVLQSQGKYEEAEEMSRQALDGYERVLGEEHPNTLASMNNLALVLKSLGKYNGAEEISRRALGRSEKALGTEHPDTLTSVNNLALVLQSQEKYEEAEEMSRQALDGYERVLGKEHPDTLESVYSLACLLHRQRKYQGAKTLYERSCAGYQKVLGTNHSTTLACSSNYAFMIEEMEEGNRESSSR